MDTMKTRADAPNENGPTGTTTSGGANADNMRGRNCHEVNDTIAVAPSSATAMTLTVLESDRLAELETVVDRGRQAFVEVGNALSEIRDSRLYRESGGTFVEYVRDRFGFEKSQAYRLCSAAAAVGNVPNWGQIQTESQARELGKAAPERRSEIFQRAIELAEGRGHSMTAAIISEAREESEQNDFTRMLSALTTGQSLVQFVNDTKDFTAIERLDRGFLLVRVIGGEVIKARLRNVEQVLWGLDETDGDYDMHVGLQPYELREIEIEAA